MSVHENPRHPLHFWFCLVGWLASLFSLSLGFELVYEQTILTWQNGPQMVGFSLAHIHGEFLAVGMLATLMVHAWLAIFIGLALYRLSHGVRISVGGWMQFVALTLGAIMFYVPYSGWQLLTIKLAGPGRRAADQLVDAAGSDRRYLLEMLLRSGVPVDARGYSGTALNASCLAGHMELARHLTAQGADLDLAPDCRRYHEFAGRIKPLVPQTPTESGLPKVPGTTVDVTEPAPAGDWPPRPSAK